jgi:hypothetical protein
MRSTPTRAPSRGIRGKATKNAQYAGGPGSLVGRASVSDVSSHQPPFFSFRLLALTAALTFTVVGSVQNAHGQKVEENRTSSTVAGFELPEGARQDPRDPERAFNPQSGQTLIRDSIDQKWIDTKTGEVVGPARTVFFGPPKGAKWDGENRGRAVNPQSGQKFVWDAGIQKWIDIKTDRVFNPTYRDEEGKAISRFALASAHAERALPIVDLAADVAAQLEFTGIGSFAESLGYYFRGIAGGVSGGMQFYAGRDALWHLSRGGLGGTTQFPERDEWIKNLLAPIDARFATAQSVSPWQLSPGLFANLSMGNAYESWWTAPDGKLVSGFLAGTTVGFKLVPDLLISEKWHWSGYTATGSVTFSFSDVRLKRHIVEVARLHNGIGLYRYRYSWSDQLFVGVMAQEVAEIVPDAVVRGADGYLRVDYVRLGLKLQTWDEWMASRAGVAPSDLN